MDFQLPFGGDWRHLKDWLNVELARYAPPGQEEWYRVEHTSTLSIGTGWARVKGLDVFEAAIRMFIFSFFSFFFLIFYF